MLKLDPLVNNIIDYVCMYFIGRGLDRIDQLQMPLDYIYHYNSQGKPLCR